MVGNMPDEWSVGSFLPLCLHTGNTALSVSCVCMCACMYLQLVVTQELGSILRWFSLVASNQ